MNISSSKEKNLTSYIRDFQSKNDFKKYLYTSITLLIVLESILGLSFNNYFSNSLEQNLKRILQCRVELDFLNYHKVQIWRSKKICRLVFLQHFEISQVCYFVVHNTF